MPSEYLPDGGDSASDHGSHTSKDTQDTHGGEKTTASSIQQQSDDSLRLYFPAYGPIEAVVGIGLFSLIVDRVTPTLVTKLAEPLPDLVPEPLTTFIALLLWLVLGATVVGVALTQFRENPREFTTPENRDEFLALNRPSDWEYYRNGAITLLGGAVAFLTWNTFISVLQDIIVVVIESDGTIEATVTLTDIAVFIIFLVGFASYARGLDRLVVGGVRDLIYRNYHTTTSPEL